MRFFKRGTEPTHVEPEDIYKEPSSESSYFEEVIGRLIADEIEKVKTQQAEEMERFEKQYRDQLEGYDFSCIRHGDFLTVFITRLANAELVHSKEMRRYPSSHHPVKFSTSINLTPVKTITVEVGRLPNYEGSRTYTVTTESDNKDSQFYGGSGAYLNQLTRPPAGQHHAIHSYPSFKVYRPIFIDEPSESIFRGNSMMESENHVTHDNPQPTKDDIVRFEGLNLNLHVPFGKGEEVKAKILAEIARGFESMFGFTSKLIKNSQKS